MPAYNRQALLPVAIESIRRQTYPHWEIVVVDDGSDDDTVAHIPRGDRIRVIRQPHSGNVAALRNIGVAAATGAFVGFLDTDDRWRPDKLEMQLAALRRAPEIDWCFCSYELLDLEGRAIPLRAGAPTIATGGYLLSEMLTHRAGIALQTVIVRIDTARALLFDERVAFGDDFDFLVRLSSARPAVCVPETLVEILQHPGRTTHRRYDQTLYLAAAFLRYRQCIKNPGLRTECVRQARRLTREYLARARADGHFWKAAVRAGRVWASRSRPAPM